MRINVLSEHVKTKKENSKIERESESQPKVENMELRGAAWRFTSSIPVTVVFNFKKIAQQASSVKLQKKVNRKYKSKTKVI